MSWRQKRILVFLLVLSSTALVQGRSLFLGFNSFWDLIHVFQNPFQNPLSFKLIGKAFTEIVEAEYTPIRLLTNSFDYTFWSYNPSGHHITSYLFFLINVSLVFFLVEGLMGQAGWGPPDRIAVAGLTAVLFGIHPLRVEVVSWITPREYLICSSFYLLCLLLYLKWRVSTSIKWYGLAVLSALGSGFSQPLSVSLPLTLLLLDYYPLARFKKKQWKHILLGKIPFILIALLVAFKIIQIRRQVQIIHPVGLSSLLHNLLEFPAVIIFYLFKTIFPLVLSPIYPMESTGNTWVIIISCFLLLVTITLLFRRRKNHPAFFTGALFFFIALLPVGGVVRSGATVLADRYVQLASIPLLLGLAWLIIKGLKSGRFRGVILLLLAAWSFFLIWKTVTYTGLWDKPVALTREAYRRWPGSKIIEIFMLRTYNNLAVEAIESGRTEEALKYVQESLKIKPDYVDAYLVWARALERQGKDEEALQVYQRALKIKRDYTNIYLNRGVFYAQRGELERAETEFQRAILYGEDSAEAHYNLGLIHKIRGELSPAAVEFKKALALNTFSPEIYGKLAEVLEEEGKLEEVIAVYERAVVEKPAIAEFHAALGFSYLRTGKLREASSEFEQALRRNPELASSYYGLAFCSLLQEDREKAIRLRDEALRRGYTDMPARLLELQ